MRFLRLVLALALVGVPTAIGAADGVLNIDGRKFAPETIKLKKGDRLVVANRSQENHSVWGHAGDYAFDFRATDNNLLTHRAGETHAIPMQIPGKYRIGCALHQGMKAVVIVEE